MSRQAWLGWADGNVLDDTAAPAIRSLIEALRAEDLAYEIDAPADHRGEWWIDLTFEGFSTSLAWQAGRGFCIFSSRDDAYGARPDEIYRDAQLAAKRLRQLAERDRSETPALKLGDVRKLLDCPQTEIAERLTKGQGFISRLERQSDARISTIREYVEALGGEVRLVVCFDTFEAHMELPRPRVTEPVPGSAATSGPHQAVARKAEPCT